MELDHHRDRDETAGVLPECLVSWIRRTSMDMGRMAADFLRPDGELSEPSLRLGGPLPRRVDLRAGRSPRLGGGMARAVLVTIRLGGGRS